MPKSTPVEYLLSELCIELGFCSAAREPTRFESLVSLGEDAFTDAVLEAEGVDPKLEKHWRRQVHEHVAKRFADWANEGPTLPGISLEGS